MSGTRWIPVARPNLSGNEGRYVDDCITSGWISSIGEYIQRFEQGFADLCDVGYARACNNGTSALHLALLALGIGPGDEVIVPTLTYVATANVVRYCGGVPVLVDSDPDTMAIDPDGIRRAVTSRTKAIIVVHLYGQPADMDAISEIARARGLFVIEDAAEAHGAKYRGKTCGSIGHVGAFSFFGNKIITTGEGGMVVTDDRSIADRVTQLRGQGQDPDRRYWFPIVGYNYRMTNIQAALGLAQLEQFSSHQAARRSIATTYAQRLEALADLVRRPVEAPGTQHAHWLYTVVLDESIASRRDEIMAKLATDGIETRPIFFPMHVLPPYEEPTGTYPVAERLAAAGISLPTHEGLTDEDLEFVADRLAHHCRAAAST